MMKKKDSCFGKKEYPEDLIEGASLLYYLKYSKDPINIHQQNEALIKKPKPLIKNLKPLIKKPKALIKKPDGNNGEQEISKIMIKDYSPDEIQTAYALLSLGYTTSENEPKMVTKTYSFLNQDDDSPDERNTACDCLCSRDPIKEERESKVVTQNRSKKRKIIQEDDTEETLELLLQQNNGESEISPPYRIVSCIRNLAQTQFSKCIYKQLTKSDVNVGLSRLMLGKKEVKDNFLCLLEESEIPKVEGVDVLVYGPNGEVHEMKFKIWIKNTPVLANGWSNFVKVYGLQNYSDVLKIWMFRSSEDRKICFVIDSIRFDDITKQLSQRILKNVFKY